MLRYETGKAVREKRTGTGRERVGIGVNKERMDVRVKIMRNINI